MPCYTLVQVQIKDELIAKKALDAIDEEAEITKNPNGTYTVTPNNQSQGFRNRFLQRYSVEKAKKEAKKEGYSIVEKEEEGETVLYLRQY